MKIRIHLVKLVPFCFALVLLFISFYTFTSSNVPPTGNTNAPGDGNCTGCHSGSLITSGTDWNNVSITSTVPSGGYVPGTAYTITVTHTMTGINKWGFQTLALTGANAQAGSFTAGTGNQVSTSGGKQYVGQTSSGNSGSGTRTWSFTWTAPVAGTGSVTFYTTINAANNNSGTGGDQIFAKTMTVTEAPSGTLPTAVIGGVPTNNTVCAGDSVFLTGSGINNPTSFAWTFTNLPSSTLQNPVIVPTAPGQILVTLTTTNAFGSSSPTQLIVTVANKPSATHSPTGNVSLCTGDSLTLSTTTNPFFQLQWQPGNQTSSSIKVGGAGTYRLKVTNPNTGCFALSPITNVSMLPKPITTLVTSADSICSNDSIILTATGTFSTYRFVDGNQLLFQGSTGLTKVKLASGTRNIGVVGTNAQGCKTDTVRKSVLVQPPLPKPAVTCGARTGTSVQFVWDSIIGALSYEVSLDSGNTWLASNGVRSHVITGMAPNSSQHISVRAVGNNLCPIGLVAEAVCSNQPCLVPVSAVFSFTNNTCLPTNNSTVFIPIKLMSITTSAWSMRLANNGVFTNDSVLNTPIVAGANEVSIQLYDSLGAGCGIIDTILEITGSINPVSNTPFVIGALCTQSNEALHRIAVQSDDTLGMLRKSWFTNLDTLNPVAITNTPSFQFPSNESPLTGATQLWLVTTDTTNGCSSRSASLPLQFYKAPQPGFVYERSGLTLTLIDTTTNITQRNWLFFGQQPDALNAPDTFTQTFGNKGAYRVGIWVIDSIGCVNTISDSVDLFPLSVASGVQQNKLTLYPNPVTDWVFFTLDNIEPTSVLTVVDVRGLLLYEGAMLESFDLSKYPSGLYQFTLVNGNQVYAARVLKR
ncbi:MAG: T9SS type A sorting domain-containing protein [Bacteroidia bacterium]|jgi:hypothetical protein|nr:T9SS type A sorting domain-containing protein [Bacteroidia bacterium]